MARYLYSELSSLVVARRNSAQFTGHKFTVTAGIKSHCALCGEINTHTNHEPQQPKNPEWFARHTERIQELVYEHLPSGSGFDSGTQIDLDASHGEKLVFNTAFHHMDDCGYYDEWTEHTVTITPSFNGVNIRISGKNRNDIKEYIHDCFEFLRETLV